MREKQLVANISQLEGCCGISVVHGLSVWHNLPRLSDPLNAALIGRGAAIATTTRQQEDAIPFLKTAGYKPIEQFMGNHGRLITIWLKIRPGHERKAKGKIKV